MREYLAIFLIVAYLAATIGIILKFGGDLHLYKTAFKRVATQLHVVSAERNKLEIQNCGLKRELAAECVRSNVLEQRLSGFCPHQEVTRDDLGVGTCDCCNAIVTYRSATGRWEAA